MTQIQICRWHSQRNLEQLERTAAEEILQAARQAIMRSGIFRIVLAGGTTPRRVYQLLRHSDSDWPAWQVYFGDERCLPPDHAERNSRMAADAWLNHAAIPAQQIHAIPAELGATAAAAAYARTLAAAGEFDLVLLGLGEDGHTASLFPGHDWGDAPDSPAALAVFDAPKPPAERVSLSARRLSAARRVIFLVSGESKRQALTGWRAGAAIPASAITPAAGVDILFEAALL